MTAAQDAEVNALQSLADPQFFRTYVTNQVSDHAQTLMQFIQEANTGQDPAIRAFARNEIPTLDQHLKEAVALELNLQGSPATPQNISGVITSLIGDQPILPSGTTMMSDPSHTGSAPAMISSTG
jgi:hypothetical protein